MNSVDQTRKIFLVSSLGLAALIIIGLVWAVVSGPGGSSVLPTSGSFSFNDDNDPATGPADAKVVVRVFGDFQCPACRSAEPGFQYALKTYGDKVRFIWNDFPLQSLHPNALAGANAARCAEAQGKFWQYHDRLYDDQPSWADLPDPTQKFKDYASALSLDGGQFATCLSQHAYQNKIMDDVSEGNRNSVDGTPTFFINNDKYVGGMQNTEWDQRIQAALQK